MTATESQLDESVPLINRPARDQLIEGLLAFMANTRNGDALREALKNATKSNDSTLAWQANNLDTTYTFAERTGSLEREDWDVMIRTIALLKSDLVIEPSSDDGKPHWTSALLFAAGPFSYFIFYVLTLQHGSHWPLIGWIVCGVTGWAISRMLARKLAKRILGSLDDPAVGAKGKTFDPFNSEEQLEACKPLLAAMHIPTFRERMPLGGTTAIRDENAFTTMKLFNLKPWLISAAAGPITWFLVYIQMELLSPINVEPSKLIPLYEIDIDETSSQDPA